MPVSLWDEGEIGIASALLRKLRKEISLMSNCIVFSFGHSR
jgi:hypothetical protein